MKSKQKNLNYIFSIFQQFIRNYFISPVVYGEGEKRENLFCQKNKIRNNNNKNRFDKIHQVNGVRLCARASLSQNKRNRANRKDFYLTRL